MPAVNYIALLVAGIASMVIGYLWYGPLFGKAWMKLSGISSADMEKGKKEMPKTYGIMYVSSLVMAYVLAVFISYAGAKDLVSGAMVGFWAGIGFVATVGLSMVLFDKKPFNLYLINVGYHVATLMVMGGIISQM